MINSDCSRIRFDTNGCSLISDALWETLSSSYSSITLNSDTRIMGLLSASAPYTLTLQQFTRNEWIFLLLLLQCYPHYAPFELLLSGLTSLSHMDCRKRIQEVQALGARAVRSELRPVYRVLTGVRAKLQKMCPALRVFLVRDAGYMLAVLSSTEAEKQAALAEV